jgi:hypothetical protein
LANENGGSGHLKFDAPGGQPRRVKEQIDMATKETKKFVSPDIAARDAQAAKTTRLRALRLAKEAEEIAAKEAADREAAAAKTGKSAIRRRAAAAPPIQPELT